jgi:acyl-CoA thioester hydrolase
MKSGVYTKKVEFCDIDYGGVVYFANYLKFFDSARISLLALAGLSFQKQWETQKLFVVRNVEVDYKKALRLDDEFTIVSTVKEITAASLILEQELIVGENMVATAKKKLTYVDFTIHRPIKIPKELRECILT